MSEFGYSNYSRFKIEEAKFFHLKMSHSLNNFKDEKARLEFFYYLDGLLAAARSVTEVFQKEFKGNPTLMRFYKEKMEEWKENSIMRFCKHIRNVSLHRYPPGIATVTGGVFDLGKPEIIFSEKRKRRIRIPLHVSKSHSGKNQTCQGFKTKSFFVKDLPKWFDESPDVMYILNCYLNEIEEFVVNAEKRIEEKE